MLFVNDLTSVWCLKLVTQPFCRCLLRLSPIKPRSSLQHYLPNDLKLLRVLCFRMKFLWIKKIFFYRIDYFSSMMAICLWTIERKLLAFSNCMIYNIPRILEECKIDIIWNILFVPLPCKMVDGWCDDDEDHFVSLACKLWEHGFRPS